MTSTGLSVISAPFVYSVFGFSFSSDSSTPERRISVA